MLRRSRIWRRPETGDRASTVGGSGSQRRRLRWLALLGALATLAVVLTPAGSGGTTTKPYTAYFDAGPVAGGSTVHINLAIKNLASQQSLGSANVTAATLGSASFTITNASPTGIVDPTQTFPTTLLKLRNLNLAPDATLNVDITVKTPCSAGSYTWGIQAKQSNDFKGQPGNDFTPSPTDNNLTTAVSGGCKLVWVTKPASAAVNTLITGVAGDPNGSKVAVKAVDGDGLDLTSASGTVTLNRSPGTGTFTSAGTGFSGTTATLANGQATFSSFMSDRTGTGFKFYASSAGFESTPDSNAFDISLAAGTCTLGQDCSLPTVTLDTNTQVDTTATGGAFTFLAIGPSTIPLSVTSAGGGCAYFQTVGAAGFAESDSRVADNGELLFTYYINKKLIQKKYGNNSGQQFIPLCAGAAHVDSQGNVVKCTGQGAPYGPWKGKELDQFGSFDGNATPAVCDPTTGLYFGILGSFQDYTNSDPAKVIDPALSPTVTGWNSDTTYRYFFIRVPSPWDWHLNG